MTFANNSYYLIILQNVPIKLGEKLFGCPYCPKVMKSSKDVRRHIMIHTGEKPYSCDYCPYACNQKTSLRSHRIKIHGILP